MRKLLEREAGRAIGSRLLVQFQVTSLRAHEICQQSVSSSRARSLASTTLHSPDRSIRADSSESREIRGRDAILRVNSASRALNTVFDPPNGFSTLASIDATGPGSTGRPGSTHLVDELQPGLVLHALVRELDVRRRERGRGRAQDDRRDGGEGHSLCARDKIQHTRDREFARDARSSVGRRARARDDDRSRMR